MSHKSAEQRPLLHHPQSQSSNPQYQTLSSPSQNEPPQEQSSTSNQTPSRFISHSPSLSQSSSHVSRSSPLPYRQLAILALLSLSEQTALNSIGPYLPAMISSFPDVPKDKVSLYIGILASSFALAQLCSNFFWGYLSDRIGRKPVLMLGSFFLLFSCTGFGFSKSFKQAVFFQISMGMLNGNAAVFPTVLGDLTDRSNQSTAFTWLPIVYSIGSITGPAMGGLFAGRFSEEYPYAAPNLVSAMLLFITIVVMGLGFTEPEHEGAGKRRASLKGCLPDSMQDLLRKIKGVTSEPEYHTTATDEEAYSDDTIVPGSFWNRTTILLLSSYFMFQLCSVAFGTLYPVFSATPAPAGRDMDPATIGLLMSIAGFVTMAFQALVFPAVKTEYGNIGTYRFAILGLALSLAAMPFVGYLDVDQKVMSWGNTIAYGEVAIVLIVRNICIVGGLSSIMLLINNSCPDHEYLGTLNGIAQSLSAAGRSLGPVIAGSVFSFAISITPKGSIVAWCLFALISFGGWLGSFLIICPELESDDYIESHSNSPQ